MIRLIQACPFWLQEAGGQRHSFQHRLSVPCIMTPILLGLTILLHGSLAMPAHSEEHIHDEDEWKEYLNHFYQCHDEKINHTTKERLEIMQQFFHLPVTGDADSETLEVMHQPRCGVPDVLEYNIIPGNKGWKKTHLTYRFNNFTADMSEEKMRKEMASAFEIWADVTPLRFYEVIEKEKPVDMEIWFSIREHGDMNPFDGPSGVLAHAYAPGKGIGGDCHFDDDEFWTLKNEGTCFFIVALHELGHCLGLDHSSDPSALMYPNYQYVNPEGYQLPLDDRRGIQSLYGPNPDNPQDATQEYDNQEDWGYEWGNEGGNEWGDEDEDPKQHPFPEGSSEEYYRSEDFESKENHDYY